MNSASPKKKRTPKSKSKEPRPTRLKVIVVGPSDLPKSERMVGYAVILGDCVHPGLILGRSADREEANKAATEWCRRYGLGPPFLMSDDDVLTPKFLNVLKGGRSEPPKAPEQQVRGTHDVVWASSPDLHRAPSSARLAMSEASTAISKVAAKLEALEADFWGLLQIATRLAASARVLDDAALPVGANTWSSTSKDLNVLSGNLAMFNHWFEQLEPEYRLGIVAKKKEEEA